MAKCSEKDCKTGALFRRTVSTAGETLKTRPVCGDHLLEAPVEGYPGVNGSFYNGFKIVIANGPPGSGKDTSIASLVEGLNFKGRAFELSYKTTLYQEVAKRYNLEVDYVRSLNENRETKEVQMDCFNGLSVREALISESEDHIKPTLGEDGVAKLTLDALLKEIQPEPNESILLMNSDGGFNVEVDYVKSRLGLHSEQLFIIRLLRNGCSFKNDSREFIRNPNLIINNDNSIDKLKFQLIKPIQTWLDK